MFIKGMKEIPYSEVEVDSYSSGRFVYKNNGKCFTGYLVEYRGDVLYSKRCVHHGLSQGLFCMFNSDGSLKEFSTYVMGQREGPQMFFHSNGEQTITYYKDGERHGGCKEYDKFGNVLREENWKNGLRHGRFKEYVKHKVFNSTILITNRKYRKDKLHGYQWNYDNEGTFKSMSKYKNGHCIKFVNGED